MTAKEALGSFFKSVADMFLEMAAQIIAKQITMIILQTILKALGAVAGGGGGGGGGNSATALGSNPNVAAYSGTGIGDIGIGTFPMRATGGPVTSQQPYMVGERGPELFVPGTGGSVVNNSDLRSAMNGGSGGASGSPVLNMSFQSTSINGVEYVSREQLESAMDETRRNATRDGAKRGMTMTLDRIQNSSSTRRKVGI
jgi:phage-related minor tail protein